MPIPRPDIPLPATWPDHARSAVPYAVALAHYALAIARGWCANSRIARVRLAADNDRLKTEVALLREELRIKDARMAHIPPRERPHYPPTERMAILQLKAARNWSAAHTANRFLLTATTIADWMRRLDDQGPDALVQLPQPVNRFPGFVSHIVQTLKSLCPTMGRRRRALKSPHPVPPPAVGLWGEGNWPPETSQDSDRQPRPRMPRSDCCGRVELRS